MNHRVPCVVLLVGLSASWVSAQVRAGGEFRVNTYTTSLQGHESVAADAAGNFVVAWMSGGQDGSSYGVFAQRYDAAGAPRGSEFRVNTTTAGYQGRPAVASDAAGNFVVAWDSDAQDGSGHGVFAQRYDASGVARGSEFRVNTFTTGRQGRARLATAGAGGFVVVWDSDGQDGSLCGVFAQRYDASGAPRGSEFRVNSRLLDCQTDASVASDATGNFVVTWSSYGQDGDAWGIYAQRFDAAGAPRGPEFRVNTHTTSLQMSARVASDAAGNFVVAWDSEYQDGDGLGIFAQLYDASGAPRGSEFRVNTNTASHQLGPVVASNPVGDFVVVWERVSPDGSDLNVAAQRFDASGAQRGAEFQVNTYTTREQYSYAVASDGAGNFVVAWRSWRQDGSDAGVFGQRFGGIVPAALAVDPNASAGSDGNGVLEPGETAADVEPSWRNVNGATRTFDGIGLSFSGPPATGVSYALMDATGAYGTVADDATALCSDCYQVGVTFAGLRPSTHWDATFTERLTPDALGQTTAWPVHVGESFTDVPKTSGYYRFVETMLHQQVTGGCSAGAYCPTDAVTREQMAAFVLAGKEGSAYLPPACGTPVFGDVPASSPFCRWIEELARRGVTGGCGAGVYCPANPVTREQMSVFLLRTLDPVLDPPACGTPVFSDVPASSPFCRWVEELARRGVTGGCGGGNYCPTDAVTREQMAVFISVTFGLTLYGP